MATDPCHVIQIDWIRHGLSCANVMHHHGFLGGIRQGALLDPDLTNAGFNEAVKAGECLGEARGDYDMVCASVMSRAIETAIGIFQGSRQTINVIPWVSERRRGIALGSDKQNEPKASMGALQEHILNFQKEKRTKVPINYEFVNNTLLDVGTYRGVDNVWADGMAGPSVDKFQRLVLPRLVDFINRAGGPRATFRLKLPGGEAISEEVPCYRIAIVSHGRFIREVTGLKTFMSDLKKAGKLEDVMRAQACVVGPGRDIAGCCTQEDPAIVAVQEGGSYKNPNTSIWRQFLKMRDCGERMRVDGHRLTKIYTPVGSMELGGGLTPADVANCPKEVRDLVEEAKYDDSGLGRAWKWNPRFSRRVD